MLYILSNVDAEKRVIHMKDISDVCLSAIDMIILKEYLLLRETFPNSKGRKYLFIQRKRTVYHDEAIKVYFVRTILRSFSGFNPQILRICCLIAMSNLYGSQFLREAYGVW